MRILSVIFFCFFSLSASAIGPAPFSFLKPPPAVGGFALVQSNTYLASTEATTHNLVFSSTPTNGNRLILAVAAVGTVTTPSGWTKDSSNENSICVYIFSKIAGASESATVAITQSPSCMMNIVGLEYSGMVTSSGLDKVANATSSGAPTATQSTGTTAATTVATELIIAIVGAPGDVAAKDDGLNAFSSFSGGYTTVGSGDSTGTTVTFGSISMGVGSLSVTSTGTQTTTGTFSQVTTYPSGAIATYKKS